MGWPERDWPSEPPRRTDEQPAELVDEQPAELVDEPAECGATPTNSKWPVCARRPHPGDYRHRSADYSWLDGALIEHVRPREAGDG